MFIIIHHHSYRVDDAVSIVAIVAFGFIQMRARMCKLLEAMAWRDLFWICFDSVLSLEQKYMPLFVSLLLLNWTGCESIVYNTSWACGPRFVHRRRIRNKCLNRSSRGSMLLVRKWMINQQPLNRTYTARTDCRRKHFQCTYRARDSTVGKWNACVKEAEWQFGIFSFRNENFFFSILNHIYDLHYSS